MGDLWQTILERMHTLAPIRLKMPDTERRYHSIVVVYFIPSTVISTTFQRRSKHIQYLILPNLNVQSCLETKGLKKAEAKRNKKEKRKALE